MTSCMHKKLPEDAAAGSWGVHSKGSAASMHLRCQYFDVCLALSRKKGLGSSLVGEAELGTLHKMHHRHCIWVGCHEPAMLLVGPLPYADAAAVARAWPRLTFCAHCPSCNPTRHSFFLRCHMGDFAAYVYF